MVLGLPFGASGRLYVGRVLRRAGNRPSSWIRGGQREDEKTVDRWYHHTLILILTLLLHPSHHSLRKLRAARSSA